MTHAVATLDFMSADLTLAELSAMLGLEPGPSSHDKGTPKYRGFWKFTIFRIEIQGMDGASLDVQLDSLFSKLEHLGSANRLKFDTNDVRLILNIAKYFYEAYSSIEISSRHISEMNRYKIELDVTSYPCCEDEPSLSVVEVTSDMPPS